MPKNGVSPTRANIVGLPGRTATPWKIIWPRVATRSMSRSRSPTELPPEKMMTSVCAHASSASFKASSESRAGVCISAMPP